MCLDLAGIRPGNQALRISLLDMNQVLHQIPLNHIARNQKGVLMPKMAGDDLREDQGQIENGPSLMMKRRKRRRKKKKRRSSRILRDLDKLRIADGRILLEQMLLFKGGVTPGLAGVAFRYLL